MSDKLGDKHVFTFTIRDDISRGIIVESFKVKQDINGHFIDDEFFFPHHQQPLRRHCLQLQNFVRSIDIGQTIVKLQVDVTSFLSEYYHDSSKSFQFKAKKLNSVKQQIEKTERRIVNKQRGIEKRKQTMANKKKRIADEYKAKMEKMEEQFQIERARRIAELFKDGQLKTSSK